VFISQCAKSYAESRPQDYVHMLRTFMLYATTLARTLARTTARILIQVRYTENSAAFIYGRTTSANYQWYSQSLIQRGAAWLILAATRLNMNMYTLYIYLSKVAFLWNLYSFFASLLSLGSHTHSNTCLCMFLNHARNMWFFSCYGTCAQATICLLSCLSVFRQSRTQASSA
jgi:hypothetical protein